MTRKALEEELKQTKPLQGSGHEAFLNVLLTREKLVAEICLLLKPYKLTQPQYNALRILRGAPEGTLPILEISERMITRDSDITRLVDRLERMGLAQRVRSEKDRRVVKVHITESGLELLGQLDEPVRLMHIEQFGHFSEEELEAFNQLHVKARGLVLQK